MGTTQLRRLVMQCMIQKQDGCPPDISHIQCNIDMCLDRLCLCIPAEAVVVGAIYMLRACDYEPVAALDAFPLLAASLLLAVKFLHDEPSAEAFRELRSAIGPGNLVVQEAKALRRLHWRLYVTDDEYEVIRCQLLSDLPSLSVRDPLCSSFLPSSLLPNPTLSHGKPYLPVLCGPSSHPVQCVSPVQSPLIVIPSSSIQSQYSHGTQGHADVPPPLSAYPPLRGNGQQNLNKNNNAVVAVVDDTYTQQALPARMPTPPGRTATLSDKLHAQNEPSLVLNTPPQCSSVDPTCSSSPVVSTHVGVNTLYFPHPTPYAAPPPITYQPPPPPPVSKMPSNPPPPPTAVTMPLVHPPPHHPALYPTPAPMLHTVPGQYGPPTPQQQCQVGYVAQQQQQQQSYLTQQQQQQQPYLTQQQQQHYAAMPRQTPVVTIRSPFDHVVPTVAPPSHYQHHQVPSYHTNPPHPGIHSLIPNQQPLVMPPTSPPPPLLMEYDLNPAPSHPPHPYPNCSTPYQYQNQHQQHHQLHNHSNHGLSWQQQQQQQLSSNDSSNSNRSSHSDSHNGARFIDPSSNVDFNTWPSAVFTHSQTGGTGPPSMG